MVKGVNKTVIEVNNTGSKLFEKIVFYVTPEYGNLSAKQLNKAASDFSFKMALSPQKPLRTRYKTKRRLRRWVMIAIPVVISAIALVIIL